MDQTHSFTCISCHVAFMSPDLQRSHYKTDWHRYNLMRKVANLAPLTVAAYTERAEAQSRALVPAGSDGPADYSCLLCRKRFASEGALVTHKASKKHKAANFAQEREKASDEETPAANVSPDGAGKGALARRSTRLEEKKRLDLRLAKTEKELEAILDARIAAAPRLDPNQHCLFCSHTTKDLLANMRHMKDCHSFFIPHADQLTDAVGLIKYLGEKISVGNVCLVCNDRGKCFHTMESVRKHMTEKGHCRIPWETEEDRAELADYFKDAGIEDDSDWEDASDVMENISEDETQHGSAPFINDHLELQLSGKKRAVHRALVGLYRPELAQTQNEPLAIHRAMQRRIGQHGMADDSTRRAENTKQRVHKARDLKIGMKNNNQKHFRDQMLQ